jgi:glutaminyl-tRNA synthetase
MAGSDRTGTDFIRSIIEADLASGKHARIHTRFPPEPNGFLHIGHAKSICLNFGVAEEYGGLCNLRFDDTNPTTEDTSYVEAIQADVRWLGFDWDDRLYHASGWFEQLYELAEVLIRKGKAYVDSQTEEQIRETRGTVTRPGIDSPYRDRSPEENLDLFRRMRAGEFEDGAHVLRAKIDMAARNMIMRDPLLYRIRHAHHYRTGDDWCIYPLYDFAHPLCDALEDITHSLCTLEFENNREIYDWLVRETEIAAQPRQIEFARLNLEYTVLSKRRLLRLVNEGHVDGWDDPRMPTIAALRRRGVTPSAIRSFADMIGVAKADSIVDIGKLEFAIRDDLNSVAPRVMCVLDPLRVVIENMPDGDVVELDAPYFPRDVDREGSRTVPFTREILIEHDDFEETPRHGFRRLAPGRHVRLRHGFIIRCDDVVKDDDGTIHELRCSYLPDSLDGKPEGVKVWGTIHWVPAPVSLPAEVRLYDRLFKKKDPADAPEGEDFLHNLNPESLVTFSRARVEPSLTDDDRDTRYQFERQGYFWRDPVDGRGEALIFNQIVSLRERVVTEKLTDRTKAGDRLREGTSGEEQLQDGTTAGEAVQEQKVPTEHLKDGVKPGDEVRESVVKGGQPLTREAVLAELTDYWNDAAVRRFGRYADELGLDVVDARVLAIDPSLAELFDEAVRADAPPTTAANWIINELPRELEKQDAADLPFGGAELAALVQMVEDGTLSQNSARQVLGHLARHGGDPRSYVEEQGLTRIADRDALTSVIDELLAANPDKVERYRAGQEGLLGFFVGQVMRKTQGRADPKTVQALLRERLEAH